MKEPLNLRDFDEMIRLLDRGGEEEIGRGSEKFARKLKAKLKSDPAFASSYHETNRDFRRLHDWDDLIGTDDEQ